ncbi:hypothetical protein [Flammeovirga kamogawensis]|uniref:Uncharacterized protein n=1 Tax=Flammeovirga kamogawensis TaxID=373891 RepID=A0ABX8GSB9_9BACT|nr:hypothetical protein [Flammeovirga kamogawensis]MBB6464019.1 hypothetical protein [Flammeovirga kamogawensis]QWG06147.1 hypothetical protein KM029_12430 [Flammeovirga kamogawensis]TRX67980.1 hypothetical protein EO216_07455 [Flammeovirga kamogawensis]
MQLDKKHPHKESLLNKVILQLYNEESLSLDDKKIISTDATCKKFLKDGTTTKNALDKIEKEPSIRSIKNILEFAKKAIDNDESN